MARAAPPQVEFVYVVLGADFPGNTPPFAAFKAAGIAGYLWDTRDPLFVAGMTATKQSGLTAGLWIVPVDGESGAAFGARAAKAASDFLPAIVVMQVEEFGKGLPNSAGWIWNRDAAAVFNVNAPTIAAAVNVLPLQDDFNYAAWTSIGVRIWPECYDGAMRYFNATTVAQRVVANGVPRDMIRPVVPSNSWAAWVSDLKTDNRFLFAIFRADQIDDAALRIVAPFLGGTPPPSPVTPAPVPPPAPVPFPTQPIIVAPPSPLPPRPVVPPAPPLPAPPVAPPKPPVEPFPTPVPIVPPDPDYTIPDPLIFQDETEDNFGEWGVESDLDDAYLFEDEIRQLGENDARVLSRIHAAWYTVVGIPGCGSHSPSSRCHWHSISVAQGCEPRDSPCNWESVNAVDVLLPSGTKITPCAKGIVSGAEADPNLRLGWGLMDAGDGRFAGYRLHVRHPGGWVSYYTHLIQLPSARPGDSVGPNTILGYSGVANGEQHLHFAVTPPRDPRLLWTRTFLRGTGGSRVPPPSESLPGIPAGSGRSNDHPLAEQSWLDLMNTLGPKRAAQTKRIRAAQRNLTDAIK